jgi:RNA polymerase sigma-70 factor, ECF subfamily
MYWKNKEFAEAYNIYYPAVFSAVHAKVGNLTDAEDICQEIFIKFHEKLETIENKRKWLFGALRLEVIKHYQKSSVSVDIEKMFQDVGLSFVNGFRDARIVINETIQDIKNFNGEEDMALFELIAVRNFTYEEASSELGMSKRQARYRYGKIVERLLDELKKKGVKNLDDLL